MIEIARIPERIKMIKDVFPVLVALCCSGCATSGLETDGHHHGQQIQPRVDVKLKEGTYAFEMCDGPCSSSKTYQKIFGTLVIDETKREFAKTNQAMQFLIRADLGTLDAEYCYVFPGDGPGTHGTLLQEDSVGFGNLILGKDGAITLSFLNDSPDFRFLSNVTQGENGFTGDWSHHYAGNGGIATKFSNYELVARRVGHADGSLCFDAVRKHERRALKSYCQEFAATTCEPGDKPTFPTRARVP